MSLFAAIPLNEGCKIPAIQSWQLVAPGTYEAKGNHGLSIQDQALVIDFDPRNYKPGQDPLKDLWDAHLSQAPTRYVKTPRGGYHFYYRIPGDLKVAKKQELWPGVDFLTKGAQVLGAGTMTIDGLECTVPGCKHDHVKGVYELISDAPIADCPASLLALLKAKAERLETQDINVSLICEPEFTTMCQTTAPAVTGDHGDDRTYYLACRGRDFGLPQQATYQIMADHFNPRCNPPWSEIELRAKVKHAYRYAKNTLGALTPEAQFVAPPPPPPRPPRPPVKPSEPLPPPTNLLSQVVRMEEFKHDKALTSLVAKALLLDEKTYLPKNIQANIVYYLRNDPMWAGKLFYNQFTDTLELRGRPDWRKEQLNIGEGLNKTDFYHMQTWFSTQESIRLEVTLDKLESAAYVAAQKYHPVLDYFASLEWDGVPRLDRLFIDTLGTADTPYTRTVAAKLGIMAVKRIIEPGCKQDYVVVLESMQGEKKSQWVQELGRPWSSTGELVNGDKDTYQNLRGKWIVELPEIDAAFNRSDFAWLKKVISTQTDRYRPSFERRAIDVPRESVFLATLNPNATGRYLKDSENRRYWPIKVGAINIDKLKEDRDQIWAEAIHRYKNGEESWINNRELSEMVKREQEARRETDPWVEMISSWAQSKPEGFTASELYGQLGFVGKEINGKHRSRIYQVMREIGYEFERTDFGVAGIWKKKPIEIDWGDSI